MTTHHLAQINVARMRAPLDSELMRGFTSQLEAINALADRAPGFVWRLQTPDGDATSLRVFDDPLMLVNMSVWESLEALHAYVYGGAHLGPMRDRRQWFEKLETPVLALWWIPAGHVPSVDEGKGKLDELARLGPTPSAFTFRAAFPPPGESHVVAPDVDAEFCSPLPER